MKQVRVLVVDDNLQMRDLIAKGLEPYAEIDIASDGVDALLKAVDQTPDMIISDYKMPGMDGRQFYEKLRARQATRSTPFIFVASRSEIEEKLRPLVDGRGTSETGRTATDCRPASLLFRPPSVRSFQEHRRSQCRDFELCFQVWNGQVTAVGPSGSLCAGRSAMPSPDAYCRWFHHRRGY